MAEATGSRTVCITQARMTSMRLPGKILLEVCGKSLLEHHLERLGRCRSIDSIVVATTTNSDDDPIVALCQKLDIPWFRGDEHDVLSRYQGAARQYDAETVVRVTSDCPLIDPEITDQTIKVYNDLRPEFDYVSNRLEHTFPRGLDTEVFSLESLEKAAEAATDATDREHVTLYIWRRPALFRLANVSAKADYSGHRWTVDEQDDFKLVRRIFEALYPSNPAFRFEDCLELLSQHPDWNEINRSVKQKQVP